MRISVAKMERQKIKYPNKTRALEEIKRIRQVSGGGNGSERLQIYYDYEVKGWFIGKAKKKLGYY